MDLTVYKLFILLFGVCFHPAFCQKLEDRNSHQSYGLLKLIENSVEFISTRENFKNLSNEEKGILDEIESHLPKYINPVVLNLVAEVASNKCFQDLKYVFENVQSEWAMKMLDSYGKPESGILLGNFKWLGEYDECLGVYAPPKPNSSLGNFHGKYCTLEVPLKLQNMTLPLSTALCLPDSCNPDATFLGDIMQKFNLSDADEKLESVFGNATLTCKPTSKKLTTGAIVMMCFLSIIVLLVATGSSITAFEYCMKENVSKEALYGLNTTDKSLINADRENKTRGISDDVYLSDTKNKITLPAWLEKCKPFFNCFCIFTNGEKLLNVSSSEGHLPCLHGIRFLTMTWIILCHTYLEGFATSMRNPLEAKDLVDHWTFQIIINGFLSVDSFFLLSGFLVAYLFFQHASKTGGKMSWLYFYVHRYIRLTPVYMIMVLFLTFLNPYLSSGPLSSDDEFDKNCKVRWWWNMLYINNFLNLLEMCMEWSWYLANDMQFYVISPLFLVTLWSLQYMGWSWYLGKDLQFYVISPLFLVTLWMWPKIGYAVIGLFFCITFTTNFAITYEYNVVAGVGKVIEQAHSFGDFIFRATDFFDLLYHKPYNRIGPYLIGILLAYYFYKRKQNNAPKLKLASLTTGWIIAACITLTCQLSLFHENFSRVETSFYNALSRSGFACGVAWVIFVCITGQGGVVNSVLSWKVWIPFSRLTYCAYLVHPIIHNAFFVSVNRLMEFSHTNVILLYLGFLIISYAVALLMSLLFESPVIRLERLLRNKAAS